MLINRAVPILILVSLLAGGCSSWGGKINNTEGVNYYSKGQYDQALSAFQTASRLNPDDPEIYYNIASTYQQQALRYQDTSLLTQAETNYRICLQKNPTHETTVCCYRGLATVLNQKKEGARAMKVLKEWEEKEPTLIEPKLEIAYLLEAQGKNEESAEALGKIAEWAPNDYRAFYKLGLVKEKMGDNAGALEQLREAARLNPSNSEITAKITALEGKTSGSSEPDTANQEPSFEAAKTGAASSAPTIIRNNPPEQAPAAQPQEAAPPFEPVQPDDGFTAVPDPDEPSFDAVPSSEPVPQAAPLEDDAPSYSAPAAGALPAASPEPAGTSPQTPEETDSLFDSDFPDVGAVQKPASLQTASVSSAKPAGSGKLSLPDGTGSGTFKLAYAAPVPSAVSASESSSPSSGGQSSATWKSRIGDPNPGPPRTTAGAPF